MRLIRVSRENRAVFQERIASLEAIATYPLGSDSFKIDHGPDYLRFFERLGDLHYYCAMEQNRVVAVAAGIVRQVPMRTWYLCDLKVHPDYRGKHLPLKMLSRKFLQKYLICRRGYAISMNPPDGRPNPIARLLARFRWAPLRLAGILRIFSLDAPEMRRAEPLLRAHRGEVSYLSLAGIKDIVLGSTGNPLPLLHAQFGPCAQRSGSRLPVEGITHMFPVPDGDLLLGELHAIGIEPSASASLIQHRMKDSDWKFVLTSDI